MRADKNDVYARMIKEVERAAQKIYRKLVSTLYTAPVHIESLVNEWKRNEAQLFEEAPLFVYIACLEQVFSFVTLEELVRYERRFTDFARGITANVKQLLEKQDFKSNEQFLTQMIVTKYSRHAREERSPWTMLFHMWQEMAPEEELQKIKLQLEELYPFKEAAKSAQLVCAYFFVRLQEEERALLSLQARSYEIETQDVAIHIEHLSKRAQYIAVKRWLQALFPGQSIHFGALQIYADQAEVALAVHPEETCIKVWNRFVQNPSERTFMMLVAPLNETQTEIILQDVLPRLRARLFSDGVRLSYVQLLYRYRRYEEAMTYFLVDEDQPFMLSSVKRALLQAAAENYPEQAKPIYHQFIVRFVEKRSRKHYIEAVNYTVQLRKLYEATSDMERYEHFLEKLKVMYRTSRVFIEELKRRA
ncbi:hypothetical protein [Shouchella lonarensis]|uniref:Uncharacterized protein n=1 Tax=Shouchella lonarensis TaxID=1464122 RepID=A0A1G6GKW2_9BACI|nr:hypothetical protein [Shouchella lonarensis]SDB82483.1 hypothetical protein SAMN05421737_101188 [Shouchella lonarensis]